MASYSFANLQSRKSLKDDTIILGETKMVGFSTKFLEEEESKKRRASNRKGSGNSRRQKFANLFKRNKNKDNISSSLVKSRCGGTNTAGAASTTSSLCSDSLYSVDIEEHEENVRKIVDDTETFRKMQAQLRQGNYSTTLGVRHALVDYIDHDEEKPSGDTYIAGLYRMS